MVSIGAAMKSAPSTDRAAKAKKYRMAARLIERGKAEYACGALQEVGLDTEDFANMFRKDSISYAIRHRFVHVCGAAWMLNSVHAHEDHDSTVEACRILALCFMAAMTERP